MSVWYIYLHLPYKSTIHVGEYTNPMDPMKVEQFREESVVMAKLSQTLQPRIRLGTMGIRMDISKLVYPTGCHYNKGSLCCEVRSIALVFQITCSEGLLDRFLGSKYLLNQHLHSKIERIQALFRAHLPPPAMRK